MDKAHALRRLLLQLSGMLPARLMSRETRMQHIFEKMKRDIAADGFFVMAVMASESRNTFAYTIGLSESTGHPELLMFGLPLQVAHLVLHDLARLIKAGARYNDGDVVSEILSVPMAMKSVRHEKASDYTVQLFNYYPDAESPPPVMQVVLPDTRGKFPWAEDFDDKYKGMQPSLWNVIH
ncbi:DUF4262 domain-containing protein [Massilia sp. TSP1-1-2]|uniref:DUF4262 domain-containing protein n=1 Tax=Massilia sp. TSP1-1-2 TaxID=2804649 RepID=UPI003CF24777